MQQPNVRTTLLDEANDVRYDVIAYRALTKDEVVMAVRLFLSGKKKRKPKRGSCITIVTVIGFNE